MIQLSPQAAAEARDALAKTLYAQLFRTLVARVNANNSGEQGPGGKCIGVLDIFGFESFASNSLEQLLINFANEKLQQQFCKRQRTTADLSNDLSNDLDHRCGQAGTSSRWSRRSM